MAFEGGYGYMEDVEEDTGEWKEQRTYTKEQGEVIVQRYNEAVRVEFQADLAMAWAILNTNDNFDEELERYGYADVGIRATHSVSGEAMSVRYWDADFMKGSE